MPSHILLLLGTSRAVNASRALLRRVFPLMHMITLSSAEPCDNYAGFDPNRICIPLQDILVLYQPPMNTADIHTILVQ